MIKFPSKAHYSHPLLLSLNINQSCAFDQSVALRWHSDERMIGKTFWSSTGKKYFFYRNFFQTKQKWQWWYQTEANNIEKISSFFCRMDVFYFFFFAILFMHFRYRKKKWKLSLYRSLCLIFHAWIPLFQSQSTVVNRLMSTGTFSIKEFRLKKFQPDMHAENSSNYFHLHE